jgi:mycofactocin glycosyltransferase
MDARSIAIGVPCYREEERIPALARALHALDPAPGALLAVDDGSRDGTATALRREGFEVLVHEQNLGLGAARNTLWRRADGLGLPAIGFLDADVIPPPDYLQRVCDLLGDDRVAGVGGRNLDLEPATWVDAWRGRFWAQQLGMLPMMDAPMLIGACATYRVAALRDVGGFNPTFRTHGEDVEIGRRLTRQGARLRYDPSILVSHHRSDGALKLLHGCYVDCREGLRATVLTPGEGPGSGALVFGMAKKGVRAPAAALLKRRDPKEALLGAAACSAGLAGYLAGWLSPRPRRRR